MSSRKETFAPGTQRRFLYWRFHRPFRTAMEQSKRVPGTTVAWKGLCEQYGILRLKVPIVLPSSLSGWGRNVLPLLRLVLRHWRSALLLLGFGFWRPAQAGRQFFLPLV